MTGILFRLFKLSWYLLLLPVHIVMAFAAGITTCALMLVDIPLWVILGRYGLLSDPATEWTVYHVDKIIGDGP